MRIAILHEQWLTHPEVGADEIAVLAVLALHASKEGTCFPTQGLLATLLGRSRPWVNKIIGTLVGLGLVVRQHRVRDDGGDRACLYRLVAPADLSPAVRTEPAVVHAGDTGSLERDTPSHDGDSIKSIPEIKPETHTAPAHEPEVSTVVSLQADVPAKDWQPTDADLLWGMERFPGADLLAATERFINRCRAKGYRYRDLSAAWRSWLADDSQGARFGRGGGKPSAALHAQARFEAWATVAHRARENRHAA